MDDDNKKIAALRQLQHSAQPHSRNLRLHRWTDASATFFITKSLHPKKPVLDAEARGVIVSAFHFAVEHNRIYLRAFVVMRNHWPVLARLPALPCLWASTWAKRVRPAPASESSRRFAFRS